jgi:hypothetical protein
MRKPKIMLTTDAVRIVQYGEKVARRLLQIDTTHVRPKSLDAIKAYNKKVPRTRYENKARPPLFFY